MAYSIMISEQQRKIIAEEFISKELPDDANVQEYVDLREYILNAEGLDFYDLYLYENQRKYIEDCLFQIELGFEDVNSEECKEAMELYELFRDLPNQEEEAPKALHDFSL